MKRLNGISRRTGIAVFGAVIVVALLAVGVASATRAGSGEPVAAGASGLAPQADDGGPWEVGFETAGGDLWQYACSEGTYLRNRLTSKGWVSRFSWCGGNAFERDFKRAAIPWGNEHNYLDTVDLMFYVGHGSTGSFTFDSNVDDHWLTPNDCYRSWGNGDNEWVGLTSCQVLSNPNLANWAACMYGGHQILGFVTNASARMGTATQGYNWAYYITNNWTVTGAWFKACDVSQPAGRIVRVLANELACYDDRPWSGIVCADSFDTDAWFWDHTCGSELPTPTDVSAVTQMPVFKTPPLSLDEAKAEYTNLGTVFGMAARPPASASALATDPEIWSVQQNNRELEMERQSGLFTYYDMNLWSAPAAQAALAPRAASITPQDAKTIADKFLADNKLMPPDARWYDTAADTLTGIDGMGGAVGIAATGDTVYQVIYSRYVTATVATAAGGPAVTEQFLVVGPGAKLKVYVPITATLASAAGANGLTVSGVQGGWRDVQAPTAASAIDAVPILTEAQIRKAYEQVESFVVLNTPPIDADGREVISPALAYWEEGVSNIQSQLIPTYGLYIKYTKGGELLNYDWAYIPANETYMRPYAKVLAGPTAPVKVGQNVTLTAADASKKLAELGHDASLTFTLGSGGPYLYDWYVDSIADANRIGQGREITYKVRPSPDFKDSTYKQTITLRVTDSGSDDLRISIASYSVDIFPRVVLPLIIKQ